MPLKMIGFVVFAVVILVFAGFNWTPYTIRFFAVEKSIPVGLLIFAAYVFGFLSALPFLISQRIKLGKKFKEKLAAASKETAGDGSYGID